MADRSTRSTTTTTVTRVRHVAEPYGRSRENPPSLGDLRAFVKLADGLPDSLHVHIENGHLDEGGRHLVTFSVHYDHPRDESA